MNEQLQQALAVLIEKTISSVDHTVAFLQSELPDVIHQLLLWHALYSGMSFVFSIVACAGLFFMARKIWKMVESSGDNSADKGFSYFIIICITLILYIGVSVKFFSVEWLQIMVAPKVWLIEYSANLVK